MNVDKSNYRSIFVLLFILFACNLKVAGQQNNSLYFMDRIPQSAQLNPAIQPKCGFYFGLPGFSSLEVNAGNTTLGFLDVYVPNMVKDSLGYKNKLDKDLYLLANLRQDWLSFGFRINDSYLTFAITERIETNGVIPKDFYRLAKTGNQVSFSDPSQTYSFDLSHLGINATWYREFAIGYSAQINDNLTFGLRAKLLFGKMNVTNTSDITLPNPNLTTWQTHLNLNERTSIPGLSIKYNADGKIDSVKFKSIPKLNSAADFKQAYNTYNPSNNRGISLDLGFVLKPIPILSFSASLLDLGYIHWKNNVHNINYNGVKNFNGFPASLTDSINHLKDLVDTLKDLNYKHDQTDYLSLLTPKLYMGVHLQLVKSIGIGFLTRFQMIQENVNAQYTVSLNLTPGRFLGTTFSYTLADGMTDNLGFAMNMNFGAIQWYIATERIPLYWAENKDKKTFPYIPEYYRNFNIHTGINFVFGYIRNKKLLQDKPLVAL